MSTAPPPAASADEKPEGGGDEPRAPNPQHISAQKRVQQQKAQVDEVVDIMRTNVEKVLERDKKLSDLQQSADALEEGASQFEKQACKLKSKFWWKNCKMLAIMIGIGVVIVIIIVVWAVSKYGN